MPQPGRLVVGRGAMHYCSSSSIAPLYCRCIVPILINYDGCVVVIIVDHDNGREEEDKVVSSRMPTSTYSPACTLLDPQQISLKRGRYRTDIHRCSYPCPRSVGEVYHQARNLSLNWTVRSIPMYSLPPARESGESVRLVDRRRIPQAAPSILPFGVASMDAADGDGPIPQFLVMRHPGQKPSPHVRREPQP